MKLEFLFTKPLPGPPAGAPRHARTYAQQGRQFESLKTRERCIPVKQILPLLTFKVGLFRREKTMVDVLTLVLRSSGR